MQLESFLDFHQGQAHRRLLLLSARASTSYTDFTFEPDDIHLIGKWKGPFLQKLNRTLDTRRFISMDTTGYQNARFFRAPVRGFDSEEWVSVRVV